MNPLKTQFSTVPSSIPSSYTLHSAIKDKLPLEEVKKFFNPQSINKKIDGKLPLELALLNNDEELVIALINAGANFSDNNSSFQELCKEGYVEIARALINSGKIESLTMAMALTIAATSFNKELVKLLLDSGGNLLIQDKGAVIAHAACIVGQYEILKMFIELGGVDVNDSNNPKYPGFTFLMTAASTGDIEIVIWLLDKGADPQIYCPQGATAFILACQEGLLNIAQHLHAVNIASLGIDGAQNLFKIKDSPATALHAASLAGEAEVVKWLLKEGADLFGRDDEGDTPWHLACKIASLETMQALYETGKIDLNERYKNLKNGTILHFFCSNKAPAVIRWLLDNGADPLILNTDNDTPIELAFKMQQEENIRAFIDKDNINKVYGIYNQIALHLAVRYGGLNLVEWLLEQGADPKIGNIWGPNSFFLACVDGNLPIAQLLYNHSEISMAIFKQDLNKQYGPDQSTILYSATARNRTEVVQWLLGIGANPYVRNRIGDTAFGCGLRNKNPEIIKFYLNPIKIKIDENKATDLTVTKFIDIVFPLIEFLLKNGTSLSLFELSIQDQFSISLKNRIKLLRLCSYFINWIIKQGSESISEKIEEFITLDIEDKLTSLKEVQLTSDLGQELLDYFIPILYKHFPQLKSKKLGIININCNAELFRLIREIVSRFKWMCDIQYNDNLKLKLKTETSLEKLFEFIIALYNTLQEKRAIVENGNNDTIITSSRPETKATPKPVESSPQIKPAKPQYSSSGIIPSVASTNIKPKKSVKNKKVKGNQKQKASVPKPQIRTTEAHQKEHPSQVIAAAPLPPLFPPQMIPLKTPSFDLESFLVASSQPLKEYHQLSELKKILSSTESSSLAHSLSLFDEVCKINRDHHQVPGFFAFDSLLIHSSHKIFHSDFMCDLFFQFVKEGYQDPFKPEQLLERLSTKHFMNELAKIDGDRKQTIRNMIKILPCSSKHAISAAMMIIGEQTARLNGEGLQDIIEICMKYKVYRNLRHRLENEPEAILFERKGVIEEGLINSGADWEEMLHDLINDLPADLEKLQNSKIMKE